MVLPMSTAAASLAGTWGLGKLVCFWDDNKISIDGNTDGWFTDDTPARFEAYGWQVVRNVNGHDPVEIKTAIDTALKAWSARGSCVCSERRFRRATLLFAGLYTARGRRAETSIDRHWSMPRQVTGSVASP